MVMVMAMAMTMEAAVMIHRAKRIFSPSIIFGSLFSITVSFFAAVQAIDANSLTKSQNEILFYQSQPAPIVNYVERALTQGTKFNARGLIELSKQALIYQPINPRAVRVLAQAKALIHHDIESQRKLLALSQSLSRRDLGTHVENLKLSVLDGKVDLAIQSIDTALRVNNEVHAAFFPVIHQLLPQQEFISAFRSRLKNNPPWLASYLFYEISTGGNAGLISQQIVRSIDLPNTQTYFDLKKMLLIKLEAAGEIKEMWALWAMMKSKNGQPNALHFTETNIDQDFMPISWAVTNDFEIQAKFEKNRNAPILSLRAYLPSSKRGIVIRKYIRLPIGKYEFSSKSQVVTSDTESTAFWKMRCVNGQKSQKIWQSNALLRDDEPNNASILIPDGCPNQLIELEANGGDGQQGLEFVVGSPTLK
jgi:hypothetical protein